MRKPLSAVLSDTNSTGVDPLVPLRLDQLARKDSRSNRKGADRPADRKDFRRALRADGGAKGRMRSSCSATALGPGKTLLTVQPSGRYAAVADRQERWCRRRRSSEPRFEARRPREPSRAGVAEPSRYGQPVHQRRMGGLEVLLVRLNIADAADLLVMQTCWRSGTYVGTARSKQVDTGCRFVYTRFNTIERRVRHGDDRSEG